MTGFPLPAEHVSFGGSKVRASDDTAGQLHFGASHLSNTTLTLIRAAASSSRVPRRERERERDGQKRNQTAGSSRSSAEFEVWR